jgi:chromosome segregation ATPase
MKRIACFALTIATFAVTSFVMAGSSAQAQTTTATTAPDQSSLGDYARKVHKDPSAKTKPKVVFDNDNLPKEDKLSVVGEATPAEADANAKTTADKDAAGKADDDQAKKQSEWKDWQDKLSAQKNSIDLSSRELDVLQKEYQLRAAAMYGDAGNRMRNAAEWDKEDADFKQKIADKQKAVEDAKQKLDDMQEEARKAGVPAAMREPQSTE